MQKRRNKPENTRSYSSHIHYQKNFSSIVYKPPGYNLEFIPFSAFWLRSSVVSVLISLISDTRLIEPHDINLIFLGSGAVRQLAAWPRVRRLGLALLPRPAHPSHHWDPNKVKQDLNLHFETVQTIVDVVSIEIIIDQVK